MTRADRNVWQNFVWNKLTTLVMFDFYDPELMCFAHKNNVRVVSMGKLLTKPIPLWHPFLSLSGAVPKNILLNDQKVDQWIDVQLRYIKERFLDGINIDIEYDIPKDSPLVDGLSKFMFKLRDRFHSALPQSQVTFDVPWSPYNSKGQSFF